MKLYDRYVENPVNSSRKKYFLNYVFTFQIGYFDPFVNARNLGLKNVTEWGVFNYLPVDQLDFGDPWLLQKEHHMNKFPLTFSVFERYPTMISNFSSIFGDAFLTKEMNKIGFGGMDGLVLGNLAEIIGFKAVIIQPVGSDPYGHRTSDGTYTGTLGHILYGLADAAFNARYLKQYDTDNIEYLLPTLGDRVCVVTPAAQQIPQWQAVFLYFDIYFWLAFPIAVIVTTTTYIWMKFHEERRQQTLVHRTVFYLDFKKFVVEKQFTIQKIYMTVVKVIIGMNARMPSITRERFIIGACLLANRVISGHFEVKVDYHDFGSLSKFL